MNRRIVRAIGLVSALLLPTGCFAAQAGAPASRSGTLQRQLQRTQAELKQQRAQADQLRMRVGALEQRSAANRAQLEQRDREIAELRRKLDAHSPSSGPGGH